jgi:hypothetical protein
MLRMTRVAILFVVAWISGADAQQCCAGPESPGFSNGPVQMREQRTPSTTGVAGSQIEGLPNRSASNLETQPATGLAVLKACFQAATRFADETCSNPANNPIQRSDCFRKARAAQLSCLEPIQPELAEAKNPAETRGTSFAPQSEDQAETVNPPRFKSVDIAAPIVSPPRSETPAVVSSFGPVEGFPGVDYTASIPVHSPGSNWTISETTSPLDYSPVISAAIWSTSDAANAPSILEISCSRVRTQVLIRTAGAWIAQKNGEIRVAFEIRKRNRSSAWGLSSDGKTASFLGPVNQLVHFLPKSGSLKVSVSDTNTHVATFQLAGLDAARATMSARCKSEAAGLRNEISSSKSRHTLGSSRPTSRENAANPVRPQKKLSSQ